MRICEKCHEGTGCAGGHPKVVIHCGPPCGICQGPQTDFECFSQVANEINSFNAALRTFSLRMRAKFIENMKDKGGWQTIPYDYALSRLNHEVGELSVPLMQFCKSHDTYERIRDESADVANFALFLASRAAREDATDQGIQKLADEAIAKAKEAKAP